jgi:hypothetical protein
MKKSVRLSIRCDRLSTQEITDRLGIQPTEVTDTCWMLDSPKDKSHVLTERIKALLLILTPVREELKSIPDDKSLMCGYRMGIGQDAPPESFVDHGFWLTPETLGTLHDLNIQFTYEIIVLSEALVNKKQTETQ